MGNLQLQIVSDTPLTFQEDEKFVDPRFMKVRISVMHSGRNKNGSYFSTEVIKQAKETFKNISILANVVKYINDDGTEVIDFGGHDSHIEDDAFNKGESKVIYDEKVVGVVPETNDFQIVHDNQHDWDVVYVTALLRRDYGNYTCDILKSRGGKTDVSAEIYCPDIKFNTDTRTIIVNKMIMSGVTLLGADRTPAMTGAQASVFEANAEKRNKEMIELMHDLKDSLDNYISKNGKQKSEEGGNEKVKIKELLEKYNVTEDQVDFETDGLSDDELEQKFAEAFSNSEDENKIVCSVNGKNFSVSLNEIYSALSELVNTTYKDDEVWYALDIYPEDHEVIMHEYGCRKGYKQKYSVNEDNEIALVDDRVAVSSTWLTDDETSALNEMKENYSVISEKLKKYEEEPKKAEILNSEAYSAIADDDEFKKLCNDHFDLSIDEVSEKADQILLKHAKSHKFEYSSDKKTIPLPIQTKRDFGKIFDGVID